MKNYMFITEYDGSRYNGWQRLQVGIEKTIQGKIEILLSKLLDEKIEIIGSGRTDAGVHAYKQTCNFKTSKKINSDFIKEFNKYLPEDIRVKKFEEVDERFHSRFNVKKKIYMYRIDNSEFGNPFMRKYSYHIAEKLDLEKMKEASKLFIGEHDFISFSKNNGKKKSTIKTIENIRFECKEDFVEVYFEGEGFLYNMVRMIVGTLVGVGLGQIDIKHVIKLFEEKTRENYRFTAPSQGLVLYDVIY